MKKDFDEDKVRLIWKHDVPAYVEDHLHGKSDRPAEFDLDRLRRGQAAVSAEPETDGEGREPDDDGTTRPSRADEDTP